MKIKGKVHCLFEQSGTFKNEFVKLGIPAEDYDIQNNFGETDHVTDLFKAIEEAYDGKPSLFDNITSDDFILAFFPCIHFTGVSQTWFSLTHKDYKKWDYKRRIDYMIQKNHDRAYYYDVLNKMVCIILERNLRMVVENPWMGQTFLRVWLKQPDVIDLNRMRRGDYMVKPTAYWFWNCTPTNGFTEQMDKEKVVTWNLPQNPKSGMCSEQRSMISPDYARNFIHDFILGKAQKGSQLTLFET